MKVVMSTRAPLRLDSMEGTVSNQRMLEHDRPVDFSCVLSGLSVVDKRGNAERTKPVPKGKDGC